MNKPPKSPFGGLPGLWFRESWFLEKTTQCGLFCKNVLWKPPLPHVLSVKHSVAATQLCWNAERMRRNLGQGQALLMVWEVDGSQLLCTCITFEKEKLTPSHLLFLFWANFSPAHCIQELRGSHMCYSPGRPNLQGPNTDILIKKKLS